MSASHPAWGEWIEIQWRWLQYLQPSSHPAWGEWIEICQKLWRFEILRCLTPHGVSGLKLCSRAEKVLFFCLTPHGVSGLKCQTH